MTRLSTLAPARTITLSLTALAALTALGLTGPAPARADMGCPTLGVVTAKTFTDPYHSIPPAVGNGVADDTQVLQDMINYAINQELNSHVEAIQLEPGTYHITKTLILQVSGSPTNQFFGFKMSGLAGPNRNTWNQNGAVTIVMDAAHAEQPAVLEIGQGAFIDATIENIALNSSVPMTQNTPPAPALSYGTQYGLFFAEQEFSHVIVRNVTVSSVGTAFAVVPGPTGGGNGEELDIDECQADFANCFYANSCGQALVHKINDCGFYLNNGGTAIKIGNLVAVPPKNFVLGYDLDVNTLCGTFVMGQKQNTFLENDGISGCVNVKGGRIEWADTVLTYASSSYSCLGSVEMRGIDFGSANAYTSGTQLVLKNFPLVVSTGVNGQYTDTFSNCLFNGTYGPVFPALSLTSASGDLSKNYFDRCRFTGYSNVLTKVANLGAIGGVVSQCRSGATSNNYFTPIQFP